MKSRNRIAILFCLAIAIHAALAAQLPKSPVTILVTDTWGAVIPGAQVSLDPAPDPAPASMQTDQKGELPLELKPGRYHLEVAFNGFKKYTRPLEVQSGKNEAAAAGSKSHLVTVVMEVGRTDTPMIEVREGVLQLMLQPYYKGTLSLSQTDFRALAHKSVTYHNEHTKSDETYLGVALSDLLANYGVPLGKDLRGKALALYVVAAGSDNYKAVLSLAEIDPAFHPGDVIVADTMNGMPLDAASGPFKLVVTEDKRPARCVHNLVSLELRSAD